ncbi:MAG: type II toxin-antitoxin system RelE/ParE family toxin [Geminicoccaceae bacterium]
MRIVWRNEACLDLNDIYGYIAEDNPAAVGEVVDTIYSYTNRQLSEHPDSGRNGRVPGTLELVMPRYRSYIVVYQRAANRIEILAVIHSRRRWPSSFE